MYLGGLCFITDRTISGLSPVEMTYAALDTGLGWIQYRDKESSRRLLYEESSKLREMTEDFGTVLIVNDHADIALAVEADGVHLGQDDLPLDEARKIMGRKIIGISTHTLKQARESEQGGADYIGFGPIFHTETKDAGEPRGLDMLREIKKEIRIPVVAIGGITLDNVEHVFEAGADAVAVASAVLKGDIRENSRRFLEIVKRMNEESRSHGVKDSREKFEKCR
ncbi:MAG: thiamine phosphate synthase [Nitrospirota bacterium]